MQSIKLSNISTHFFKGLYRPSNVVISSTTPISQRLFSSSFHCSNVEEPGKTPEAEAAATTTEEEAKTKTADAAVETDAEPAEAINPSRRRKRFLEWIKGQGAKYSRPSEGSTNYLGDSYPFPKNPLFRPRPPLSDALRQEMYDLYISDSAKWTIRKLATKYGISLKRVEAVLKLKDAEKDMEKKGVILQRKFNKGMEKLMGVDQTQYTFREPLIDIQPHIGKPRFKILDEDQPFTPVDAAKALGRTPFQELQKRTIEAEANFTLESTKKASTDSTSGSKRSKLVIVDTSS
ncbi:eukaryotic mitochondrial regulator protein-domain-containing protein [Mycotypha africana]|uniref:eukaryotic mitochondrial regulator protein-domain-containing protein n=1 Tax=Mycotypha africana TaxID=64632 RepID=UPI0023018AF5|nr:eukaryotic mitochondrial regulator protein-domain-containing protein [Mycotypha africana]KAI8990934.1 eukaryotic mitochondrial regulator protein-domain-containing protein [Mycotypha africana]